jgi:hypothetical protein
MQTTRRQLDITLLVLCWLWALWSLWVGAMSGMLMSSRDPAWVGTYVNLIYESMFLSMLVSLFTVRLAAFLSIALTLSAVYFTVKGHGFGYGPAFVREMLEKIALRSGILSVVLLCVSPIGAVELYLKQRRSARDTPHPSV